MGSEMCIRDRALDRSQESNLWSPLAITVIGGLLTSSILTLVVVPSMYIIFEDIREIEQRVLSFLLNNRLVNRIKGKTV